MKYYKIKLIFVLLPILLIISCGEPQEDIDSRKNLEAIIRQINIFGEEFASNKKNEKYFSENTKDEFHNNYIEKLNELKYENAKITVSKKFFIIQTYNNILLKELDEYIELASKLCENTLLVLSDMKKFNKDRELYYKYSSDFTNADIFKQYATLDGLNIKFSLVDLKLSINKYYAQSSTIDTLTTNQNKQLVKLNFNDTLSLKIIQADSNDVFIKLFRMESKFNTTTDDF